MPLHVTPPRRQLSNRSLFLGAMIAASALLLGTSRGGDFVVEANAPPASGGAPASGGLLTWVDPAPGPGSASSGGPAGVPTPGVANQAADEGPASVASVQEREAPVAAAEPTTGSPQADALRPAQGLDGVSPDQGQPLAASLQSPVAGDPATSQPATGNSRPASGGTPAAAPPAPEPAIAAPAVALTPLEGGMMAAINARRAAAGLRPVVIDPALTEVARERSTDMAGRNYFSHTSLEGTGFVDLLMRRGIQSGTVGEILGRNNAADPLSVGMVVEAFGRSPSHQLHIVYAAYEWAGVGAAVGQDGMKYFTIIFRGPA